MSLYLVIIRTLGGLAVTAVVAALVLVPALALPGVRTRLRAVLGGRVRHPVGWAWTVALVATLGSLYLSDVVGFLPCKLCWYQRIAMYPLVFVLGVGLWRGDAAVWRFAIPLPVVGLLVSAYHVVLQYQPTLDVVSCDASSPCTVRYVAVFGFVSIPVMAGAAFLLIIALLLLVRSVGGTQEGS